MRRSDRNERTYHAVACDLEVLLGHWGLVDVAVKITTGPGKTLKMVNKNYILLVGAKTCTIEISQDRKTSLKSLYQHIHSVLQIKKRTTQTL